MDNVVGNGIVFPIVRNSLVILAYNKSANRIGYGGGSDTTPNFKSMHIFYR